MITTFLFAFVMVCGIAMEVQSYRQISVDNEFFRLPVWVGRFSVAPSGVTKKKRWVAGWFVLLGLSATTIDLYEAGFRNLSIGYFLGVLVTVYTVPAAVIAHAHNKKYGFSAA